MRSPADLRRRRRPRCARLTLPHPNGCPAPAQMPGDPVMADEPLVELETDKVTLEVNAPASGTLGDIVAKDGETVGPGAVLGSITEGAGAAPAAEAKASP